MPKENRISRAELMAQLEKKLAASGASKLNKDMQRLCLQSAAFLLGDPKRPPEADLMNREQAEKLAGQIMRKLGPNYMEWNYGNLRDPGTEKHFEGMLLHTIDGLALPPELDRAGKKEALQARIEARGPTYGEYLLMNTVRPPADREYRASAESGPGSQVTEKTGKVFTALTHCMSRNAGLPVLKGEDFDREARVYCGMPLCRLTLRNARTAELLEHREFGSVAVALKSTQDSFQFADRESFQKAQKDMKQLIGRMSERKYEGAQARDWQLLKQAAKNFCGARYHVNNADAVISAKLFLAAEAFLTGHKAAPGDPGTEMALAALSIGVPDAARNPDVKNLMGRLNSRQGPEEAGLAIPDRGAPSVAAQPDRQPGPAPAEPSSGHRGPTPEFTL